MFKKPKEFKGDFYTDKPFLSAYSVDASIYQILPRVVVCPKDQEDLNILFQFAHENHLPVIPRGAGTSTTGGALGEGLICDMSRYFHKILEFDSDTGHTKLQCGVVQDQLNRFLFSKGRRFGPDTSTGNRATLGGMAGNNASGAHSIRYGRTIDHVLDVEMMLPSGEVVNFSKKRDVSLSHPVFSKVKSLLERHEALIEQSFPKIKRNASGYALLDVVRDNYNLSKLLVGSEGSLGLITEMTVSTVMNPKCIGMGALFFNSMHSALRMVPLLMQTCPFSLEYIDGLIIKKGQSAKFLPDLKAYLRSNETQALVIIEFEGENESDVLNKQAKLKSLLGENTLKHLNYIFSFDTGFKSAMWSLRKMGLALLMKEQSQKGQAIAFLEDMAVPNDKLNELIEYFRNVLGRDHALNMGIYGHAGAGCMHLRPVVNISDEATCDNLESIMVEMTQYLKSTGGVLSGEHGDGLIRSWLNESLFGPEIYTVFAEIKTLIDPKGLFNPHKVVGKKKPFQHLKHMYQKKTQYFMFPTFFDFSDSKEGLRDHLRGCNGNGECRKTEKYMCPSFQGSQDELKTTRARASSLLYALENAEHAGDILNTEQKHILDHCLACKGCKSECPSSVDIAKVKVEFLYQYYKHHKRPLADYFFSSLPFINKYASSVSPLLNYLTKIMHTYGMLPVHPNRKIPEFKKFRLSHMNISKTDKPDVVLFVDSFTRLNEPEIVYKASRILNALDISFFVLPYQCCGRMHLSKGFLDKGYKMAKQLIEQLNPYASQNVPVLFFEPSCLYTVLDDYSAFKGFNITSDFKKNIHSFTSYLSQKNTHKQTFKENIRVFSHTHCYEHQYHREPYTTHSLNAAFSTLHCESFGEGCCGMAGSFGYDRQFYDASVNIAKKNLSMPTSFQNSDLIIADGFSCRHQISHLYPNVNLGHSVELLYRIFLPQDDRIGKNQPSKISRK